MDIQVYVSCKNKFIFPKDSVLRPVQVDTQNAENILPMENDATGENISNKYYRYKNLTTQYWAFKNKNSEYVGFLYANKYFNFSNTHPQKVGGGYSFPYLILEDFEKYAIRENAILQQVQQTDILLPQQQKLKITVYEHFIQKVVFTDLIFGNGYKRDLDFCIQYIQKKYPQIYPYAIKYLKGKKIYFNDIYIVKNKYFQEYSQFLFDVLFAHEKECDCSLYGIKPIEVSYELSNCLGGIYFYYLLQTKKNLQVKYLSVINYEKVEKEEELAPAFVENNIAILLAPNENYMPHAAVAIQSIIENSSKEYNYDIILFKQDIVERTKNLLLKQIEAYPNFSIRIYDVGRIIYKYSNLPICLYFSIEMYFRILAPYILPNYDKILYLDSDTVVLKDIAELYSTDIQDNLVGACLDLCSFGSICIHKKRYAELLLTKIDNAFLYYNSGVLLINTKEFRKTYTLENIMQLLQNNKFQYPDQDALNYLTKNRTYILDPRWNTLRDAWNTIQNESVFAPKKYYDLILKAKANPYIIHYISPKKPWNSLKDDFSELYWQYARKTVFYEQIIYTELQKIMHSSLSLTKVSFKSKCKKAIKKVLLPFVNLFFPRGSVRREKLKKLLCK